MEVSHSLPTLDISPLREECFAHLNLSLPDNFANDCFKLMNESDWFYSKLNHREYGDPRPYSDNNNPLNIDHTTIDQKTIVRQHSSGFENACHFNYYGDLPDLNKKDIPVIGMINDMLGSKAKHFDAIIFLKFNSNQGFMPHKDGGGGCRIYIPISPIGMEYSRLEMYHENQIYYVYNEGPKPRISLFSQEVPHALFNQGYPDRYNLQISSRLSYKETLALFDEN